MTILLGILQKNGIEITPDEATVMMLGIYEDTGSLVFPSTTVDDYLAAAHLAGWLGRLDADCAAKSLEAAIKSGVSIKSAGLPPLPSPSGPPGFWMTDRM